MSRPVDIRRKQTFRIARKARDSLKTMGESLETLGESYPKMQVRDPRYLFMSLVSRDEVAKALARSAKLRQMDTNTLKKEIMRPYKRQYLEALALNVTEVRYVEEGDNRMALSIALDDEDGILAESRERGLRRLRGLSGLPDLDWPYREPGITLAVMETGFAVHGALEVVEQSAPDRIEFNRARPIPKL